MLALADYRAVVALADERHFGRAARRLGITQPALTSRLRRIESAIDARLFERSRRGVESTEAGIAFVEGARRLIDLAVETADAVRGAKAGFGQTLRIGMTQIAAYQVVGPALARFRAQRPLARIRLEEGTTASLEASLESRQLDLAFLHPPLHASDLSERCLAEVPFQRFHGQADGDLPLIRYPRGEAPVLMRELARLHDTAPGEAAALVETTTILGAITLSSAGYGPFAAPADFPHPAVVDADGVTDDGTMLETSIAWRTLDRRPLVQAFAAAAAPA
ncbi:MAG: LysR family transcriptional regulator [Pseudomonadota bacterium]